MKTILLYLVCSVILCSCNDIYNDEPVNDCVYVLGDVTDSLSEVHNFSVDQLRPFLASSTDPMCGANVWVAPITDLRYNPAHRISLGNTNQFTENEFERKASVDTFYKNISAQVANIKAMKKAGTNGSQVFFSLSKALKELASCSECTSKTLVVLSDLREYSTVFNSYDTAQFRRLKKSYLFLKWTLDNAYHIPSLHGIKVYLIHEPASKKDDEAFFVLSDFMKKYLTMLGATVSIGSNLQP